MKQIVLILISLCSLSAFCLTADLNGDHIVNAQDFFILASQWLLEDTMGLGPELIKNGTFDSEADWTFDSPPWSIGDNVASYSRFTMTDVMFFQGDKSFTAGKTYRVQFTLTVQSGLAGENEGVYCVLGGDTPAVATTRRKTSGIYAEDLTCAVDLNALYVNVWHTAEAAFSIDNVSVREVTDDEPPATDDSMLTEIEKRAIARLITLTKADDTPVFNNIEIVDGVAQRKKTSDGSDTDACVDHWAGQIESGKSGIESFERFSPFAFTAAGWSDVSNEGDYDPNIVITLDITLGQSDPRDRIGRIGAADKIGLNRITELVLYAFNGWHPGDGVECDPFYFRGNRVTVDNLKHSGIQLHFEADWIPLQEN
ncbi:MAG: hypothetical protein LLF76_08150 [Planctomycetaceae bacterium]|nr:hypothetical protein [Planctomycetaceae bacterium]